MWRARGLVLALSFLPAATLRPADEGQPLAAGAVRERELSAGLAHGYEVQVEARDFLHAIVTPQGIDVGLRLIDPEGRELLSSDLLDDPMTPEQILAVAETPGCYQIKVVSPTENVPAGRYVIRLEAQRPATSVDVIRVGAMRDLEAGFRARYAPDAASHRQAITRLETARSSFREAGDREGEARALLEIATDGVYLARPEAFDQAIQALVAYRELDDKVRLGEALNLLARIHDRNGELAEAFKGFSQALALAEALGNRLQEATFRLNLGIYYGKTGDFERSLDQQRQALSLARTMRSSRLEAALLGNLGITAKNLGEHRLSLEYYEQALRLARARGDRAVEANTLNNMGNLHRRLGDNQKALEAHREALALAREVENAEHEARALNTLGSTHYQLGDFQKALDHHDQALAVRRRLNDLAGQASALDGAGQAWHRLGKDDLAFERLNEALRIRRAIEERSTEADTLLHLAVVERDRGNLARALEDVEASVKVTDSLRGGFVSPDLRTSFIAAEHERYELHIDVLMQLHREQPGAGFDLRALEASERGRARVLLESLLEARTDIRQGIDPGLLERERANQRQRDEASTRLSRLMSRSSKPDEVDAARAAIDKLGDESREVEARIRKESPGYAALTQPRPLTTAEIQRELDANTLLVEFALGESRSWLWTVSPSAVDSFALPARGEIEAAAREVYRLLTTRQPKPGEPPAARADRVAEADAEWRRQSLALGRMLLGPAATHLGDAWRGKRLVIVAEGMLAYLPFSALSGPGGDGQALLEKHEIVSLPSASVLAVLRRENAGRRPAAKSLAVLADPVFDIADPRIRAVKRAPAGEPAAAASPIARAVRSVEADTGSPVARLSRLPFSRQEADAIAALVPAKERLQATDFEASRTLATSGDLGAYRRVHFATHGFLNSEHPELSGLVLSLVGRDGRAQDGFLRLNDIYNLRLSADVVVLSACQTALGKEIKGEGLVGLTRGFMYAGSPRVVASLWQVDDESTAELMKGFYRAMLERKLPPAAALRSAQLELAATKRWAAPYYWAAFVLQGEWR
jgi:CHAT domain-containing protein/tetratricopeptide (TPR) repeat protein